MSFFAFPRAPEGTVAEDTKSILQALRQIGAVLNRTLSGKLNAITELTLTANAATTVLTDARLTSGSYISFDPMTANASTEKAAGTIYVLEANRRSGAFTVTHANNAQTDRKFKILIIG